MKYLILTMLFISFCLSNETFKEKNVTFITDPVDPFIIGKLGETPTRGIVVDIIDKVFNDIEGYKANHVPITPWQRTLKLVETGKIDAISVILKNEEREKKYYYSNKVISAKTVFFYKSNNQKIKNWSNPKDLEQFTICTVKGYNIEKYLHSLKKEHNLNINIYSVNDFGKCFKLQLKNRVDLYAENYYTGTAYLKKQNLYKQFEVMPKPIYKKDFYFAFSKWTEAHKLIPQINESLKKIQDSGYVEKIEKKYLKD